MSFWVQLRYMGRDDAVFVNLDHIVMIEPSIEMKTNKVRGSRLILAKRDGESVYVAETPEEILGKPDV